MEIVNKYNEATRVDPIAEVQQSRHILDKFDTHNFHLRFTVNTFAGRECRVSGEQSELECRNNYNHLIFQDMTTPRISQKGLGSQKGGGKIVVRTRIVTTTSPPSPHVSLPQ